MIKDGGILLPNQPISSTNVVIMVLILFICSTIVVEI